MLPEGGLQELAALQPSNVQNERSEEEEETKEMKRKAIQAKKNNICAHTNSCSKNRLT